MKRFTNIVAKGKDISLSFQSSDVLSRIKMLKDK